MCSKLCDYRSIDLTDRAAGRMLFWRSGYRTGRRNRSAPGLRSDNFWLRDDHGLLWGDVLLFLLRLNPDIRRVPFASDRESVTLRMVRLWWCRNRYICRRVWRSGILHIGLDARLDG